jgi:hypothetical protein
LDWNQHFSDESAYGAFVGVADCEKNNSYICIVISKNMRYIKSRNKRLIYLQSNHDPRSPRNKEDDCMKAFGITQGIDAIKVVMQKIFSAHKSNLVHIILAETNNSVISIHR